MEGRGNDQITRETEGRCKPKEFNDANPLPKIRPKFRELH